MAYNPEQPRIPKGNKGAGRWTKYIQAYQLSKAQYIYNSDIFQSIIPINLEIDEMVPCLRETITGNLVDTTVRKIHNKELNNFNKSTGWLINWGELAKNNNIFGVFVKNKSEPEGLISLQEVEGAIFIEFMCAAPHNNKTLLKDKTPKYKGVGGHLFAIAIKNSIKSSFDGYVFGFAKNKKLLNHYISEYNAIHISALHPYQFIIEANEALKISQQYHFEEE